MAQHERRPVGNALPCTYVHCANPSYATLAPVRERVRQKPGWGWETLDTGHDAMVLDPDGLVALLERLAAAAPSRARANQGA
jgi:hypothetical protein